MEQLCTNNIPNGVVPIQAYIRWLQQLVVQQEWDGEYDKAEITQRELSHVMDYQEQTGSLYYPMF